MTGHLDPLFRFFAGAVPAKLTATQEQKPAAKSRQVRRAEERRQGKPKLGPAVKRKGS